MTEKVVESTEVKMVETSKVSDLIAELSSANDALVAREKEIGEVLARYEQEAQQLIAERTVSAGVFKGNQETIQKLSKLL